MKIIHVILFAALLISTTGCEVDLNAGNRSGSLDDDYIEEPISKFSSKYENALLTSNKIIELLKNKAYKEINQGFIHNDMKGTLTAETISSMQDQVANAVGPIKKYKKMQWGFLPANEDGKVILFSFKIIEHEKTMLNYAFVFENDGKYNKLIGLHINERNGPRFPNNIK